MAVDVTPVYQAFLKAQCAFDQILHMAVPTQLGIGLFDEDQSRPLPMFLKDQTSCEAPDVLKYFREIRFYGNGDAWARVMVDNTVVATTPHDIPIVMEEDVTKARIFNLPRGTCGYWIDVESVMLGRFMFYDVIWEPVSGQKEDE